MMAKIFSELSVADFKKELELGDRILIDVRTIMEQMQYGVVSDDQLHIDVSRENAAEKILALPKESKYLIYCFHANRTKQVQAFMRENGFHYVKELAGGIDAWNNEKEG